MFFFLSLVSLALAESQVRSIGRQVWFCLCILLIWLCFGHFFEHLCRSMRGGQSMGIAECPMQDEDCVHYWTNIKTHKR
jgi:hypothetical protein